MRKSIRRALLLTFLLFFVQCSWSQDTAKASLYDGVFTKVEIEASFPGGVKGWNEFLAKNLNIDVPYEKKAKPAAYKVMVQFIVDKNGELSDIKTLTNYGYGMEEEVTRVLKLSPRWVPARQNGHDVKAYKLLPITFMVHRE